MGRLNARMAVALDILLALIGILQALVFSVSFGYAGPRDLGALSFVDDNNMIIDPNVRNALAISAYSGGIVFAVLISIMLYSTIKSLLGQYPDVPYLSDWSSKTITQTRPKGWSREDALKDALEKRRNSSGDAKKTED